MKSTRLGGETAMLAGSLAALLLAACAGPSTDNALPGAAAPANRYAEREKRGTITIFPDTYGDPTPEGITAGPDGALWFIDPGMDVIGRITASGEYTLEASAGAELSDGITVGADKNLWFTVAEASGGIGRITTAGKITLFADPGGSYTQGITLGSDGALWFAESNGTVGRMNAKGKVTHFTVAASNAELEGITAGPDGNLWVTELADGSHTANRVYRVTTRGKSKAFTVGSSPDIICVGTDNALWFTENGSNAIGRLTVAGAYKDFPIGIEYGGPVGIASGSDGALWFTEAFTGPGYIGRMTLSGKMRFFQLPPESGAPSLQQITLGPDNAMWFASAFSPSAIGRITMK
jgi:virginiamycin B lyase